MHIYHEIVGKSGIIQSFNPVASKTFQIDEREMKGLNILQFLDCGSIPELIERSSSGSKEFLVTRYDGTTFPASLHYADCHGRFFSARITDITERKIAEKKYLEGQAQVFHVEVS